MHSNNVGTRIGDKNAKLRLSPAELEVFMEYAAFLGRRDLLIWLQNGQWKS